MPSEFLEEVVLPRLFERLDEAFPEFGWRQTPAGWTATARVESLGSPRPERVVCNQPGGLLVHGDGRVAWTAYINGGEMPTGRDFVEAVHKLADLAGVDASAMDRQLTPEEAERYARHERRAALLETFMAQAQDALRGDSHQAVVARSYLEGRGFKKDELEALRFGLYVSQDDVEAHLVAVGFTADEVRASGLLADGRWAGRLVLPWRDCRGHIATVAARDVNGAAESGAKYLYLKDGKKPEAFGLDVALRPDSGGRDHLVIVEGLLDVVALQRLGFRNVAALGGDGKLLTADRWAALASLGVKRATLVLDNDKAGREGTLAALDNAQRAEQAPVVWAVCPEDLGDSKDPDEFVRRHGLDAFREVVGRRVSGAAYRGRAALGDVTPDSPPSELRDAVDKLVSVVERLRGPEAALDAEDLIHLAEARTGYTTDALADLAQVHTERRRREEAEAQLRGSLREAQDGLADGQDVFGLATNLAAGLAEVRVQAQEPPAAFSVDRLLQESAILPAGKRSGWDALDKLEVRFCAGELALLAGRTSHGKTSALVGLLHNWLWSPDSDADPDEVFVFYSCEEAEVRIFHRLVSLQTVAIDDRRTGSWWSANVVRAKLQGSASPETDHTWPGLDRMQGALERLRSWEDRLLVVYRPAWSIEDLVGHARHVAGERRVGAVLVDYLQRIPPPAGRYDRRDIEISAIGRQLKALSVDLDAPVVASAQISRQAISDGKQTIPAGLYTEKKVLDAIAKRRPQLHHLREGGSEQEADLVLGLLNYRADYTDDPESGGRANVGSVPDATRLEIGVLKNRYGTPGCWAALAFEGAYGLLRDQRFDKEV